MVLLSSASRSFNFLRILRPVCTFGSFSLGSNLQLRTLGTRCALWPPTLSDKFSCRNSNSVVYCSNKGEMSQQTKESDFVFRQLLEHRSFTLTYLLADKLTKEAILIDPVIDTVDRDIRVILELGLNLTFAVNTHVHADHITGTGELKKKIPGCRSVISEVSGAKADVFLKEGDFINFGKFKVEARSTPGHTNGCMSYVWHEKGMVFTGDAVLIRGCGRTDFQEGDPGLLYDSVHKNILSLPEDFLVYPAHDYTGQTVSSVGEEKKYNPRLTKTKEQFIHTMKTLNLAYPKQIDKALPANLVCGIFDDPPKDG